jgi:hypothetical protein
MKIACGSNKHSRRSVFEISGSVLWVTPMLLGCISQWKESPLSLLKSRFCKTGSRCEPDKRPGSEFTSEFHNRGFLCCSRKCA